MSLIADIVNDIIAEHYDYLSVCEKNITETERSIAILQVKTRELQAQAELAEQYFNFQMKERERLFDSASKVLEKAMKTGDSEFAEIAVKVIEIVNKKSPFSFQS